MAVFVGARLPRTLRLAHRGDWRDAPENSLAAMEAALDLAGCDGLEFDVRSSFDGAPVLLHDASLRRVQRLPVMCSDLTAAELASVGIPTLGQVLDVVGSEPFLDVELKEPVQGAIEVLGARRGGAGADGLPTLRSGVVSSFQPAILRWLAAEQPTWPRWINANQLSSRTIDRAVTLGCEAVSVEWHAIDEASTAHARAAGLEVVAWTVRDPADRERLARLRVVAICAEAAALDA